MFSVQCLTMIAQHRWCRSFVGLFALKSWIPVKEFQPGKSAIAWQLDGHGMSIPRRARGNDNAMQGPPMAIAWPLYGH